MLTEILLGEILLHQVMIVSLPKVHLTGKMAFRSLGLTTVVLKKTLFSRVGFKDLGGEDVAPS